ncbi:hypothetical protein HRbin11_01631 [bacterium HR11]|nr:hypothetical protein HRbin11_01631 [bacterium HR11]
MRMPIRTRCIEVLIFVFGVFGILGLPGGVPAGWAQSAPEASSAEQTRLEALLRELERLRAEVEQLRTAKADAAALKDLENRIDVLTEEVQRLREAAAPPELPPSKRYGLGPSASRVYQTKRGVSLAGYGEFVYQNVSGGPKTADALRMIMYLGYRFTDRVLFNSEVEFEHAKTEENLDGQAGEVALEFAYVDFLLSPALNVRAGLLLHPLGIINEVHEPPTFHGVLRPDVERVVIPSTWRELGVGVYGELGYGFHYRAYLTSGLDARGFEDGGLREGRGEGNRVRFVTPAGIGRLDWIPTAGLTLGVGAYAGRADQGLKFPDGRPLRIPVRMAEVHGLIQHRGLEVRGLYVRTWIGHADQLNLFKGLTGDEGVAEQIVGGYVEAAFNLFSLPALTARFPGVYLAPFVRWEVYDTHHRVPVGFERNPALHRRVWTLGLTFKPIPAVVIKADFQDRWNEAGTARNQWNLGIGFNF